MQEPHDDTTEKQPSTNPFDDSNLSTNPFDLVVSDYNPFSPQNLEKDNILQKPQELPEPTSEDVIRIQAEHEGLKKTRDQVDNIAYALKPDHSTFEKILNAWRNMSTGGQVAGCVAPLLPGFGLGMIKYYGLVYISSAAAGAATGVGLAVAVGFGVANYIIQDHMQTNKTDHEKYQEHLRELSDTLDIVKTRLHLIYMELALQTEEFRKENQKLKSSNEQLEQTNATLIHEVNFLNQTSLLLEQDRTHLKSEIEKMRQSGKNQEEEIKILESKLHINQEKMIINNKELEEKNQKLAKLIVDMGNQQEQSKKTIVALNATLQQIIQSKVQHDANGTLIIQKLDGCVNDFQAKLHAILENMSEEYGRLQKAVTTTEQNNKKIEMLLEEHKTRPLTVKPPPVKEEPLPAAVQPGFMNSLRSLCNLSIFNTKGSATALPVPVHVMASTNSS